MQHRTLGRGSYEPLTLRRIVYDLFDPGRIHLSRIVHIHRKIKGIPLIQQLLTTHQSISAMQASRATMFGYPAFLH